MAGWRRATLAAIAVLVFATWAAVWFAWIWFVAFVWPSKFGLLLALILLAILVLSRPRLPKLGRNEHLVARADAPELFRLVHEITAASGPSDSVLLAVDTSANASTTRIGLRRRWLVTLGQTLWVCLTPEERVAIVAHEVAHETNGDVRRSFLVGTSMQLLDSWRSMLDPGPIPKASENILDSIAAIVVWLTMVVPWKIVGWVLLFQLRLSAASSRAAELEADRVAISIAGSAAMASALRKLTQVVSMEMALDRNLGDSGDPWPAVAEHVAAMDSRTAAAFANQDREAQISAMDSHPPTAERIEAALSTYAPTRVHLIRSQSAAIDQELCSTRIKLANALRVERLATS